MTVTLSSTRRVLPDLSQDNAKLLAEIERLKAELETAKTKRGVSLKITEKGALSVYGLGRFPVTLYQSQWTLLLQNGDTIMRFLTDHASELATKS